MLEVRIISAEYDYYCEDALIAFEVSTLKGKCIFHEWLTEGTKLNREFSYIKRNEKDNFDDIFDLSGKPRDMCPFEYVNFDGVLCEVDKLLESYENLIT